MPTYRLRWLLCCCLLFGATLWAQSTVPTSLTEFNTHQQKKKQTALLILGGWALGNIAAGSLLAPRTEGDTKYFHRMNAYWNTVNLGIAAFGYYSLLRFDPATADLYTSINAHYSFQKILLFNAGLDVGYLLGGAYLLERSKHTDKNPARMRGYGRSIIVQGGFLLLFDLVNAFIHAADNDTLQPLLSTLSFTGAGVGWRLLF